MLLLPLLAAPFFLPLPQDEEPPSFPARALVLRVDRIETLDGDPIVPGVLVIREGVIQDLGAAVLAPEGAEVRDLRGTGSTVLPPFVLGHANFLQSDRRGRGKYGRRLAAESLWLGEDTWSELVKEGVLLAAVDPPGTGIPGRTSVLAPGEGRQGDVVVYDLHLKLTMEVSSSAKSLLRDAIKAAEKAIEDEEKAQKEWQASRKAWEEEQKKKVEQAKKDGGKDQGKKSNTATKEEEKSKEDKEPPKEFEPPKIAPDLVPLVEWLRKERVVQVWISDAAAWLHWLDVLEERELPWEAVLSVGRTTNFHEVTDRIADAGVRVHIPSRVSWLPYTRTRFNLVNALSGQEVPFALEPAGNSLMGVKEWRMRLAELVQAGSDRTAVLRAATLEPALALGQETRVEALKAGGPATFMVWSGDPLDPETESVLAVSEGEILFDREEEDDE